MSKALICINTITSSFSVFEDLKNIDEVSEVHSSKGMYNIVASVKADSMNKLSDGVLPDIRRLVMQNQLLTWTIPKT